MDAKAAIELVLLLLLVATALAYLARRLGIPYPILLVIGGSVLGLLLTAIPDAPTVQLPPDVVFLLFLPPILFGSGYFTQIRDFKANGRAIGTLAIGLVLFSTVVVGLVAGLLVPSLQWAQAFALGAIVAPPDAVAATSVLRRVGAPRRVVTILEGESLVNDASALIAYRVAVAAAITGSFSLLNASMSFVVVGVGGVLVGIAVGWIITAAWRRTGDATLQIILSLIAPISAYLAAEAIGVSGVLATVVAGLIAGRRAARALSPGGRLVGVGVWTVLIFLIDSFVFMLIGLQLPVVLRSLSDEDPVWLVGIAVVVSLTVIVARIVWVIPALYLPRWVAARRRTADTVPVRGGILVIAWAGLRGAVSLAAALSLPIDPTAIPDRDLIIYLTFCVILATLVGQGLTLPWVVTRLHLVPGSGVEREEALARQAAIDAALGRLAELEAEYADHLPLIEQLRARFEHEAEHPLVEADGDIGEADRERLDHLVIQSETIEAQRDAVIQLRDDGVIGDEALRRVERDLDLEMLRTGI